MGLSPTELADRAAEAMLSKKATDVRIIDLRNLTVLVDYFVIGSAQSEPQMKALVEAVTENLKAEQARPWHIEGASARRWVLIDYVDVVVHLFREETRAFYGLERLWGDAPAIGVVLNPATGRMERVSEVVMQEEAAHE